jgi:hydrogenase expression/formation protein HypC
MCLAIPGEVIRTFERDGLTFAETRFGSVTRDVCLAVAPDVIAGDFVLVHVGFAIAKIDRERAERAWTTLSELSSDALDSDEEMAV